MSRPLGYVTLIKAPLKCALEMLQANLTEGGIRSTFDTITGEYRVSVLCANLQPAIAIAKDNLVTSLWPTLGKEE